MIRLTHSFLGVLCSLLLFSGYSAAQNQTVFGKASLKEQTSFQTSRQWKPATDVRSDVVLVYGAEDEPNMTFEQRIKSWQDHGYNTHFMTCIAWGSSLDNYFQGAWDGKEHTDEYQREMNGSIVGHKHYYVPTLNYLMFMKQHLKRAIDAGLESIYIEEPEFWAESGYSESFKREWRGYYGFEWRPQHESAENTYLSNKLKYYLYYRALNECFTFCKEYGKTLGKNIRCYVPTHSLLNYSQWSIVSPEASLASLPCVDGYIAQVWTGTSREPNYFNGVRKERVFENAFLEYGCMESMTAPTHRRVYFLTDPIEDRARDWADYKVNYQATFLAEILYPKNNYYEVMPWPDRIYEGLYQKSATNKTMEHIPRFYSTQMQVMINTLNNMPLSDNKVSGSTGVGVLMANSLMFQRAPQKVEGYEDPQLSNFYGMALPLLKRGVPVHILHLENVSYPETWKDTKVLLMTYSNMKPLDEKVHQYIADWVKNGGVLLYCSSDTDPFQNVLEWWNQNGNTYKRPSDHLFQLMGIDKEAKEGEYDFGEGTVYVIRQDPKDFIMQANGDKALISTVKYLYENKAKAGALQFKNSLYLERGFYDLAAVLDEGISKEPLVIKGKLIDLFDPKLPILIEKKINPGEQSFLLDINRVEDPSRPQVLCGAARVYDEKIAGCTYSFVAKSPANTTNVMRVLLPSKPKLIVVKDTQGKVMEEATSQWDGKSRTVLLIFENNPEGVQVIMNR